MKKTSRSRVVLAGDVGGTKTRLGLFLVDGSGSRLLLSQAYPSRKFDALESVIEEFLPGQERLSAATFGVAGPVVSGTAVATNLPWKISERSLKKFLSIRIVSLVNDLVANAHGIEVMQPRDFMTLNRGSRAEQRRSCRPGPDSARRSCSGTGRAISLRRRKAAMSTSAPRAGWNWGF
jgi:glucokinase